MSARSFVPIALEDLRRLGDIAAADRADLFARKAETATLYATRLFAVALCQGGALHYVDRRTGVKDLDVWSFYTEDRRRRFPARRRAIADFGDPKFGAAPDMPEFVGRRVDLIGRSIPDADASDPVGSLRRYFADGKTVSARMLAKKAVVLIEPAHLLGTVVWSR